MVSKVEFWVGCGERKQHGVDANCANFHEFLADGGALLFFAINTNSLTGKLANAMKGEGGSNGDRPISRTLFWV